MEKLLDEIKRGQREIQHKYRDKKYCVWEEEGAKVYLSPPEWSCDWFWGFGYLGNEDLHFHFRGIKPLDAYDLLRPKYGEDSWIIVDYITTFYTLQSYAELCKLGSSNICGKSNEMKSILKNETEYTRINCEVLPQLFESLYKVLDKYEN